MEKTLNGRITMKHDTTSNWEKAVNFTPKAGEYIVYDDYAQITKDNILYNVPNFKIGDGVNNVNFLPFVGDDLRESLATHVGNTVVHITSSERINWNGKISCDIADETITFS